MHGALISKICHARDSMAMWSGGIYEVVRKNSIHSLSWYQKLRLFSRERVNLLCLNMRIFGILSSTRWRCVIISTRAIFNKLLIKRVHVFCHKQFRSEFFYISNRLGASRKICDWLKKFKTLIFQNLTF